MINHLRNIMYAPGMLSLAMLDVQPGEKVRNWVANAINQLQIPLVVILAAFAIIRIGYPLITGDEQDQRAAKKRIFPMILGAAVVAGALYWAQYVQNFVEF